MKNALGKIFTKQEAGEGEVTPFRSVTTALAATVGTGTIAGVTGAIGGPGAVFWMWLSTQFGMLTKYSEVALAGDCFLYYGCRCCEFMLGSKSVPVYQVIYVICTVLGLSGVVFKLTKEHFNEHRLQK